MAKKIQGGDSSRLNVLTGTAAVIAATQVELDSLDPRLYSGMMVLNQDTSELKVAFGNGRASEVLRDHGHPYTHAPLVHKHLHGTNQVWRMGNPRLWYRDDLVNHPGLIPLDGTAELNEKQAAMLSKIYPGSMCMLDGTDNFSLKSADPNDPSVEPGWNSERAVVNFSSSFSIYYPTAIFGGEVNFSNFMEITDQWLVNSKSLDTEIEVTVHFKYDIKFQPTEYWIMPAAGTSQSVVIKRPTPKSWTFKASNNGVDWVTLDHVSNDPSADEWNPNTVRTFSVSENNVDSNEEPILYSYFKLTIHSWHAGAQENGEDLEVGIRRFWMFGRKQGVFELPVIESPHDAFVWVIPVNDLGVSLLHEDVGDLGQTCLIDENLPAYRIPTDGRALSKTQWDLLFSSIGHTNDVMDSGVTIGCSDGNVTGVSWVDDCSSSESAHFISLTPSTSGMMAGSISMSFEGFRTPKTIIIEGWKTNDGSDIDVIYQLENVTADNIPDSFIIDTIVEDQAYVKYHVNFLGWNEGTDPIGCSNIRIFMHPLGMFYVPDIPTATSGVRNYIVGNVAQQDVSTEVLMRLQNNIIQLTQALTDMQQQLNAIDSRFTS